MREIFLIDDNDRRGLDGFETVDSVRAQDIGGVGEGDFLVSARTLGECREILASFRALEQGRIAIERRVSGLSSAIFLVSIPKAGTHLYMNLLAALGFAKGGELIDDVYAPGNWYYLRATNAHTEAYRFFSDDVADKAHGLRDHPFQVIPTLFGFRFPKSMLFSEARYYRRPESAVFAGYYEGLDDTAMIKTLLVDDTLRGRFVDRTRCFLPYFRFSQVIPLSYEALAREQDPESPWLRDLVWRLQLTLAVPGTPATIAEKTYGRHSETLDRGRVLDPDIDRHNLSDIEPRLASLCEDFGYETSYDQGTVPTSRFCISSCGAELTLRFKDDEEVYSPVLLSQNYLGHNIVRYRNAIYGWPQALRDIADFTDRLSGADARIAGRTVFAGRSVEGVKARIFGSAMMSQFMAAK